ncbi:sugar phosphate isomerase/epimerase family protein [Cohnella cellulosilytica]|uniref:Sugar phosphate isomerase/epimerase family protein n=1 Tax=Cohnella cellulosilytica TaxID=986710 RepID=A0ABW2F651_9BACL
MNRIYAMDTFFYHSLGSYPLETRCEMLRELGYDGAYLTLWDERAWRDVERLSAVRGDYGLDVAAVYVVLDVALPPEHPEAARILELFGRLQGCDRVELALTTGEAGPPPSDPAGDAMALAWLRRLLAAAEPGGVRISLYHHVYYWMERWQDALRLVRQLQHPLLGIAFSSFHWYAVDGRAPEEALTACLPYLHAVNLCGSRKLPDGAGLPASIERIEQGELDIFHLLQLLRRLGYEEWIGFQGYGIGGDAYAHLDSNKRTYLGLLERLSRHPEWRLSAP